MADNRIRFGAEVVDGFTGPLARMVTALGTVQQRGAQAGAVLKKDFDAVHGSIGRMTTALQGVTPVLGSFGVGAFGAVTSIAGMSTALRSFSGNTQALRNMSTETGVTIDRLRAFGELGERFGVSADTMKGAVRGLASNMHDLRLRHGALYESMQGMNLGALAEKMIAAPNMDEVLKRAMEGAGKIPSMERLRRVMTLMFGTPDLAVIAKELGGDFEKVMADIQKRMGRTTQDQIDASRRFEQTLSNLRASMDGLRNEALTPLLVQLESLLRRMGDTEGLAAFRNLMEQINQTAQTTRREFEAIAAFWESSTVKKVLDWEASRRGDRSPGQVFGQGVQTILGLPGQVLGGGGVLEKPGAHIEQTITGLRNELHEEARRAPQNTQRQDELRREITRLTEELRRIREQGATVQQQSFSGGGFGPGGLIHRAAYPSHGAWPLARGGGPLGRDGGVLGAPGPLSPPGAKGSMFGPGALGRDPSAPPSHDGPVEPFKKPAEERRGGYDTFDDKASQIMPRLMKEFGLTREQAAGIVGNLGHESGGFRYYQERNPTRGRGGAGWAQWTGPRRRAFEAWAAERGLDPRSDEASYGYLTQGDPEFARALRAVRKTQTVEQASVAFEETFERAGVKAYGSRFKFARRALRLPDAQASAESPPANQRIGDAAMRRFYGDGAPVARGPSKGSLDITLNGFPAGARARASMDDLFKDVQVSRSRQMETSGL